MTTRPRLTRSIPYWALVVGSAASTGFGIWLTIDKLSVMSTTLTDGSATGVEVYVGQSWAVFATAFVGAGLVGFVAALALAAGRSFVADRPVEVVEAIAWTGDEDLAEADLAQTDRPAVADAAESDADDAPESDDAEQTSSAETPASR